MMPGSLDNGAIDAEYTPPVQRVAPPLGDVVHAHEQELRRLQNTVAVQSEQMDRMQVHQNSLVARIYAMEQAVKRLEAAQK